MIQFNINTDAAVVFTNKLEKLHRSALPNAVRSTLNSLAFDVKKRTLLKSSSKEFTNRNKTFFKAKSRVQMAKGFDVRSMRSMVGFVDGDKNQAVADLEKQERGGSIKGRGFVPMDTARVGKNNSKQVRKPNKLKNIRNIERVKSGKLFMKKVHSIGTGGHILYKKTLFEIKKLTRGKVKLNPLYSYKRGRSVEVKQTHFMKKATFATVKLSEKFFKDEALKQIKRLQK